MKQRNGAAPGRGAKVVELRPKPDPSEELKQLRTPRYLSTFGREALGRLIVDWRLEHGLSTAELADDAGFSVEVIEQLEKGSGLPSARHLLTLSELMELSFEKLLRLVGLVEEEADELHDAALRYLAQTSNSAPGSLESTLETLRFRKLLSIDSGHP
ncbi:MAG: helix-turn-helix transcriptional regulator [Pirellulales bacterium]|nr:helix-turn-helix transcriptional regulator [Pirellulales bacterium]